MLFCAGVGTDALRVFETLESGHSSLGIYIITISGSFAVSEELGAIGWPHIMVHGLIALRSQVEGIIELDCFLEAGFASRKTAKMHRNALLVGLSLSLNHLVLFRRWDYLMTHRDSRVHQVFRGHDLGGNGSSSEPTFSRG